MLLDFLQHFKWHNEPENVRFDDSKMLVSVAEKTDFWQAKHHNYIIDTGHFFHTHRMGNFGFVLKMSVEDTLAYDQCGLMLKVNHENWAKVGLMTENNQVHSIASVVTIDSSSDLSLLHMDSKVTDIWFKMLKKNNDYILYYSIDGDSYVKVRQFYIPNAVPEIAIGAFFCSPKRSGLVVGLEKVEFF